jgi:hypothetical protein
MNKQLVRRFLFGSLLALLSLAATATASAQYPPPYPPPPPPYPPGPTYPPPPYPPQQYPRPSRPYGRSNYNPAEFRPYAMFTGAHYSGLGVGNGTSATQSGGLTALGGTFGASYLFANSGTLRAGVDGRFLIANSANSTTYGNKVNAGFVGFRIDGSGGDLPAVPYFQFEVGGAATNNGTSTTRTGSFAYQAQFGVDVPIIPHQVSARAEYGAGQLTNINSTNHTLQTFSVGVVFHIH